MFDWGPVYVQQLAAAAALMLHAPADALTTNAADGKQDCQLWPMQGHQHTCSDKSLSVDQNCALEHALPGESHILHDGTAGPGLPKLARPDAFKL